MNTKICTSIDQGKKLLELGIDVNTADMYYQKALPKSDRIEHNPKIGNPIESLEWYNKGYTHFGKEPLKLEEYCIPAWSLAALRACLPPGISIDGILYVFESHNTFDNEWVYEYKFEDISAPLYSKSSNEIDAAFEMVCWLKENGKI